MTGCNLTVRYDPDTGQKVIDATGPFGLQSTAVPMDCTLETLIEAMTCAAAKLAVVAEMEKDHE